MNRDRISNFVEECLNETAEELKSLSKDSVMTKEWCDEFRIAAGIAGELQFSLIDKMDELNIENVESAIGPIINGTFLLNPVYTLYHMRGFINLFYISRELKQDIRDFQHQLVKNVPDCKHLDREDFLNGFASATVAAFDALSDCFESYRCLFRYIFKLMYFITINKDDVLFEDDTIFFFTKEKNDYYFECLNKISETCDLLAEIEAERLKQTL
jgi:hypothetical protein